VVQEIDFLQFLRLLIQTHLTETFESFPMVVWKFAVPDITGFWLLTIR
jgi:hypothetical protein